MGVLDDAIREHLELKRKHGAPEQEVEQQAQEALGPPVRQPVEPAQADPAPEAEAPAEPGGAYPASATEPVAAEPEPEPIADEPADDEPFADEPIADPMADDLEEPVSGEPGPREDELLHDPIDEAFAEPAAEEPAQPETRPGDTPPRGFEQVADSPLPAQDVGEHDVLEETPDFLEETPEHDRLWFEQKPPRDFDFDE
jgi:hypothetical protein